MKNKVYLYAIAWVVFVFTVAYFDANGASIFNPSKKSDSQKQETTVLPPIVVEHPGERISLYWENTTEPHPERAPWTDALIRNIDENFDLFASASDITRICPKFHSITDKQKTWAIGEFWVALSYYESGFKPAQESQDVGTKTNKDTWSVGLYQMSVVDVSSRNLKVSYQMLKDPIHNINVSMEQLKIQITKTNLFILPNSSKYKYWAIILDGNKYQKIQHVLNRVKKSAPFCY